MNKSALYSLAVTAVSKMDKERAAKGLTAVANAVANGQGHPGIRLAASVLATSLQVVSSGQASTAPRSTSEPLPTVNDSLDGWQEAVQLLRRPQHSGLQTPDEAGEGRNPSQGRLLGPYDTANIAAFAFTFFNGQQLSVNQLGGSGNVGGQFWVGDLPGRTWVRLKDRGDRLLPVWIRIDGLTIDVQVDGGPEGTPVLSPADMLPRSSLG